MERSDAAAAGLQARVAGAVYLLFFLTAVAGAAFLGQAGIGALQLGATPADAARTANTFLTHEASFQIGFGLTLFSTACYVAVTGLLYRLFRPVSGSLALVAALLSLMGLAVQTAGSVFQLAPLVVLGPSPYLAVIDMKLLQALALLLVNLGAEFGYVALVFDGLWLLLLGYLIYRSTFLPRALGVLVALAGLGWEAYLAPPLVTSFQVYIEAAGFLAEAALMLWLVAVGVNAQRWVALAGAGREANVTSC